MAAKTANCAETAQGEAAAASLLCRNQLGYQLRRHVSSQLYDDSGAEPLGTAIYTLSDPRDIRNVRYVGQTSAPRRRFLQHLNAAMLWLPEEMPWWVNSPKLRPLSAWIRELHRDGHRLPLMVVSQWVDSAVARVAERAQICECLENRAPLLNVETEILGRQMALI